VREIAQLALTELRAAGADYADARAVERDEERIVARDGSVRVDRRDERGLALRALVKNAWGFSATAELEPAAIRRCAREAVEAARVVALVAPSTAGLGNGTAGPTAFAAAALRDPFAAPLAEKIQLVQAAVNAARRSAAVKDVKARVRFLSERVWLATSDGVTAERRMPLVCAGIRVLAAKGRRFEIRTAPAAGGGVWAGGLEAFEHIRFEEMGARAGREAEALLAAPLCPAGEMDVVLDPWLVARLLHETLGHAATSRDTFVGRQDLGKLRVGSHVIHLYQDPAVLGSPGTVGFDDEGIAPRTLTLVHAGVMKGVLCDRERARRWGTASSGAARSFDFRTPPSVRLTNLVLGAGHGDAAALSAGTTGVYLEGARAFTVDARRASFRLSAEAGWELTRGRRGRMVRDATFGGSVALVFEACDAVGGAEARALVGLWCQGQGQSRAVAVGHRVPPIRLRKLAVGPSGG
jgi:TldD protein